MMVCNIICEGYFLRFVSWNYGHLCGQGRPDKILNREFDEFGSF